LKGYFIRARVDDREQIASLDPLAFFEAYVNQFTCHTATDVYRIQRRNSTERFGIDLEISLLNGGDPHRCRTTKCAKSRAPAWLLWLLGRGWPEPPDQQHNRSNHAANNQPAPHGAGRKRVCLGHELGSPRNEGEP